MTNEDARAKAHALFATSDACDMPIGSDRHWYVCDRITAALAAGEAREEGLRNSAEEAISHGLALMADLIACRAERDALQAKFDAAGGPDGAWRVATERADRYAAERDALQARAECLESELAGGGVVVCSDGLRVGRVNVEAIRATAARVVTAERERDALAAKLTEQRKQWAHMASRRDAAVERAVEAERRLGEAVGLIEALMSFPDHVQDCGDEPDLSVSSGCDCGHDALSERAGMFLAAAPLPGDGAETVPLEQAALSALRVVAEQRGLKGCDGGGSDEPCAFPSCIANGCDGGGGGEMWGDVASAGPGAGETGKEPR